MAGVYFFSSQTLVGNARALETEQVQRHLRQAADELEFQVQQMHTAGTGWCDWDDTYRFMKDKNMSFIASNLPKEPNSLLDIDLMMFLDTHGKVFYSTEYPRPNHQAPVRAEDVRTALGFNRPQAELPSPLSQTSGVVSLPTGEPVIVSVWPIRKSSGASQPRGWLVTALRLDALQMNRLAGRTHFAVDLLNVRGASLSAEGLDAMQNLVGGSPGYVKPVDDQNIAGYSLIRDVFGRPVKLLKVSAPRTIYAQAIANRNFLIGAVAISGVLFVIVIMWLIEIAALSRVSKLTLQVERIGSDDLEDLRVSLSGKDELAWLAQQIDDLVLRLRQGRIELRHKNETLEGTIQKLAETNHILENAVEGIAEVNDAGAIVDYNTSFAELHGYLGDRMRGFAWQRVVASDDHEAVCDAITEMIETGKSRCEVRGKRRDGSFFYEEIMMVQAHGSDGRVSTGHWFAKDISERKELEAQIKHQAYHDPLTGLPNRTLFVDCLRSASQRSRRRGDGIAVLFLDLDDFKVINDSMGHEAGDHLLAGVAERIQSCVRKQDTVSRLGGDEFTVLLDRVSSVDEATEVADRILESLKTAIELPHGRAFACTSIGIAFSKAGEHDPETLMHDADMAMYHAKDRNKASYAVYTPEMKAPVDARRELAEALQSAIETDSLALAFQPIINLTTGRPTGIEAFVRWHDPVRGDIPAQTIILVAEEAGLMEALGLWCLRRACLDMRDLIEIMPQFKDLEMNVNMSAKQLLHPEISENVEATLSECGLPPSNLRIEISARSLAANSDKCVERLLKISDLGVKLAIDDFGTGSHLISKLGDYPVDMVKIDGTVTWMLDSSEETKAIAQAMMIMAKSANVRVVAESVETQSQLRQLRELECTEGQGMFFSGPVSITELLAKLAEDAAIESFSDKIISDLAA